MMKLMTGSAMAGRVIALLFGLFAFVGTANATNYFTWGVETPANNAITYGDPCVTGNSAYGSKQFWLSPWSGNTTQNCSIAHTGSCSMRIIVNGADGGNQQAGPDSCNSINYPFNINGSSGLYYRWWMRIDPGFSWGISGGKTKSSRVLIPGGQSHTGYIHSGGFRISECQNTVATCNAPGGIPNNDYVGIPYDIASMNDGQWHEYIVFIKPSSSSGVADALFRAWVDGVEVPNSPWCSNSSTHCSSGTTGFILSANSNTSWAQTWGGWMARPYFQMNGTASDGGTIYIDDVSTDDAWNSIYAGGDTTPPSLSSGAPSGTIAYGTTTTTISVATNESAQCKYGTVAGVAYSSIANTFSNTGGATHSQQLTGLINGGNYSYYVRCQDSSGNANQSDYVISFGVATTADECTNWQTAHPAWIWCDDFETDTSSQWADRNGPTTFLRVPGVGRDSGYGMRATYPATTGVANAGDFVLAFGNSPITPKINPADTTVYRELFWRVYVRTSANWQPGSGAKFTRATGFVDATWSQSFIAHWWGGSTNDAILAVDPASGVCRGGLKPDGITACTNNTVITSGYNNFPNLYFLGNVDGSTPAMGNARGNVWQCIEGHIKLNTPGLSDGIEEFWIDGTLEAQASGKNFVGSYTTYGINTFLVENYMNAGTNQVQYRDWDKFVLSTARIGCAYSSLLPAPGGYRRVPR